MSEMSSRFFSSWDKRSDKGLAKKKEASKLRKTKAKINQKEASMNKFMDYPELMHYPKDDEKIGVGDQILPACQTEPLS